ncbi:hypothetical protein [uncultured Mameliella sp.]|uniref:hypothetical protein n=1 Tax=uncultured Mameliella sp. TaxID=1447087 RepID=UPI0026081F4B|nr:hypothetical protein [uncultured Mameliella sp.]
MRQRISGILCAAIALAGLWAAEPAEAATRFYWSSSGPIAGKHCTQIVEGASPASHTWRDNYLCTDRDIGLRWSASGAIFGMKCTQIIEGAEPAQYTWRDNYLCLPQNSPLTLRWSPSGSVAGLNCVQMVEGSDPYGWRDNYLCWSEPSRQTADLLTITKIQNIRPAGGLDSAGKFAFGAIGAAVAAAGSGGISVGDLYDGAKYGVAAGEFLDKQFSGQDDLILKIDGRNYLPPEGRGTYHAVHAGQVLYPNIQAAISGAGMLQLIEYDDGSDNDNLGVLVILGGRSYSAQDIVVVAPASEDGSIYLVSYKVEAGRGNPDAVAKSMLCGTNQCDICYRLDCANQPYGELDRDGDKPDLLRCPPHFDENGFNKYPQFIVDDVYLRKCLHKMVK